MTQIGTYRYGKGNSLRLFRITLPIAVAERHIPPNITTTPWEYDYDERPYESAVSENISTELLTIDVWTHDKPSAIKKIRSMLESLLDRNY